MGRLQSPCLMNPRLCAMDSDLLFNIGYPCYNMRKEYVMQKRNR
ncbi:hypothetical protein CLOBOL_02689 [Enterocloster bolteae ATCC BAA-613]|uniref:Uncharacterized protein n=1 Tax=Enterocloster bolteae (strain ATCC BAA-613 / DSM 15670 / CCUG 46953 / JCM 12243 / WAL 16351) TaxID=411902 RepID=A8RQA8_ENTBW|nr:hypothetical protein CLOBOL_02689 [Enterocloster bolteae ATCC BAA-613]